MNETFDNLHINHMPNPTSKMFAQMSECGIIIDNVPIKYNQYEQEFVEYTLPSGWRTVNNSHREDCPDFFILDDHNMARFTIGSSWQDMHDNDIHMSMITEPYYL